MTQANSNRFLNFESSIEFDKIESIVCNLCTLTQSADIIRNMPLYHDAEALTQALDTLYEMVAIQRSLTPIPLFGIHYIADWINMTRVQNFYLEPHQYLKIKELIDNIAALKKFFDSSNHSSLYPKLSSRLATTFLDLSLSELIDQLIDPNGDIRDNATPRLSQIRNIKRTIHLEIDQAFRGKLSHYRTLGYLADTSESVRNGRRVLAVLAEKKRAVSGIVHDESESGNIVYIEPQELIERNNEALNIENEEKREIIAILRLLAAKTATQIPILDIYQSLIIDLDIINAKALLALKLQCSKPKISSSQIIKIENGYHPILLSKNIDEGKPTIPFSLELSDSKRMLMLSGPNAGGKSITLKSIGLLLYMNQLAYPIPVLSSSTLPIISNYYSDIGDSQSIEDELSTYSSKIKNWNHILDHIDHRSLVLLDEMGTGTDPSFGAAMAQVVLEQCLIKKCYSVCTTHFGQLKKWADSHPNVLNGSMIFDEVKLEPTYRLVIGIPGSSYTFHIAQKMGMKPKLIERAKSLADTEQVQYESMLLKLEKETLELNKKKQILDDHDHQLKKQINVWQRMTNELELLRAKLKYERINIINEKERAKQKELLEFTKQLKNISKQQLLNEQKKIEKNISETTQKLKETYKEINHIPSDQNIQIGDWVKYIQTDAVGQIIKIEKNKAQVLFDNIKTYLPLTDLVVIKNYKSSTQKKSSKKIVDTTHISDTLDLRGQYVADAIPELERYLNQAIVLNKPMIKIIHGRGTLRNEIIRQLKSIKAISKYTHADAEHGGEGVTWVHF